MPSAAANAGGTYHGRMSPVTRTGRGDEWDPDTTNSQLSKRTLISNTAFIYYVLTGLL